MKVRQSTANVGSGGGGDDETGVHVPWADATLETPEHAVAAAALAARLSTAEACSALFHGSHMSEFLQKLKRSLAERAQTQAGAAPGPTLADVSASSNTSSSLCELSSIGTSTDSVGKSGQKYRVRSTLLDSAGQVIGLAAAGSPANDSGVVDHASASADTSDGATVSTRTDVPDTVDSGLSSGAGPSMTRAELLQRAAIMPAATEGRTAVVGGSGAGSRADDAAKSPSPSPAASSPAAPSPQALHGASGSRTCASTVAGAGASVGVGAGSHPRMLHAPYPATGPSDEYPEDVDVPHLGILGREEVAARMAAEELRNGDYAVRISPMLGKHGPAYGLAVMLDDVITHYKITKHRSKSLSTKGAQGRTRFKHAIQMGLRYEFVAELIEHYHEEEDGLCCVLGRNISYLLHA